MSFLDLLNRTYETVAGVSLPVRRTVKAGDGVEFADSNGKTVIQVTTNPVTYLASNPTRTQTVSTLLTTKTAIGSAWTPAESKVTHYSWQVTGSHYVSSSEWELAVYQGYTVVRRDGSAAPVIILQKEAIDESTDEAGSTDALITAVALEVAGNNLSCQVTPAKAASTAWRFESWEVEVDAPS